mmetsp:Transcript_39438/g.92764  ORF Transcript_39438/g.92764 Transcript_39438/m.92764 type:complete len:137 (-) Transcript_39438:120-530(-)|eukprot:CAMPEP_0178415668 /NCGR_PEP_ID=MMETSP0689_2-20121128/23669_1 /TAXON_ID=160604 /ORGANISM="Amphidinium massartii, Strain CS-259" /LENGTH=136 /DNA_ID=CAMNT_0020036993 /DNA_START=115 /DNA_END=525 /DNA_ORIENTATION=+
MSTGVVTFCGVPDSLKTFEKIPFSASEDVNGRKAYKTEIPTSDGPQSFGIWYNEDKKVFVMAPSSCLEVKDKFSCFAYCPAGDAKDPTEVTSQWVVTSNGKWEAQQEMFCAFAKIIEDEAPESDVPVAKEPEAEKN